MLEARYDANNIHSNNNDDDDNNNNNKCKLQQMATHCHNLEESDTDYIEQILIAFN